MLYNISVKDRLLQLAKFAIGWPLSIVAIYFIYRTFSEQINGFELLADLNYVFLGIALIFFICYFFFRSYFWLKMLHYLGHDIPFHDSSFLWLFAQLKRYIPGNIWSYLGLAVSYNERNVSKRDIAYAVLIESEFVIIVTFIFSLFSTPFIFTNFIHIPVPLDVITAVLTVLFFVGAVFYLFIGNLVKKTKGKVHTVLRHLFPTYTPRETMILMFLMACAYICYGLGYYFSISAIIPLTPEHILTYFGIFLFSLVAGFISFVTPTGLGVREGFMTVGLAKFIPTGIAAFSALFSRLVIVFAELIAIGISYVMFKHPKRFQRLEQLFTKQLHEFILWLMIGLFMVYFAAVSVLRYVHYYTGRFDLGNMAQTVWNTSQGRIFLLSNPNGSETVSRLAFHADFILVLFAPLYWIWADPRVLVILQAFIVAFGAYFVYKLALKLLKYKTLALVLAFSYLMNPSIQRATLYDFHAVVLATTFLLGAVYFLFEKRYGFFLLFAVLAALTKEQVWVVIACFGPILFFSHRKKVFGTLLFLGSLGIFYYLLWHAIPNAAGQAHFALSYFSEGGESPSDIIKHILFSPVDSLQTAFSDSRLSYYQKLLLPVGYVPLLFPFWLIPAAPDIVLNIFSDRPQLQQIYYQYTAIISTFLYVSAIYGLILLRKFAKAIPQIVFAVYIAAFALIGAYLYGPLPGSREANLAIFTKPLNERFDLNEQLRKIPPSLKVSASNNIASHLSEREDIYVIPKGIGKADIVILYRPYNGTNSKDTKVLEEMKRNDLYEQYYENSVAVFFRLKNGPDF